jgi:hypothetical protein
MSSGFKIKSASVREIQPDGTNDYFDNNNYYDKTHKVKR